LRTAAPGYVFNFAPFGRFKIKTRPEKTVRDFRSGKIIKVPPQNVITFLPSKKFKKELNTDFFSKGE
jgi:nucleoid DNA-binding protein